MTQELKHGMKQADEFVDKVIGVLNKDLDWQKATVDSSRK